MTTEFFEQWEIPSDYLSHLRIRKNEHSRALDTVWFHASNRENWTELLDESKEQTGTAPFVHVGTLEAAHMRAQDMDFASRNKWFVYTLAISPRANIHPSVFFDQGSSWERMHAEMLTEGYDGVLYANDFEDEGSLSLMINSDLVQVLERETHFQMRDSHASAVDLLATW